MIKNLISGKAKNFSTILNFFLFLLSAIIGVSFFLLDFNKILIFFLQDDAFYYFKIAQNFVSTGSFTFDGITGTNGFHPLWMIFLVIIFYFFKLSAVHTVQLILILQLLLILISLYLLISRIKNFYKPLTIIIVLNCFLIEFLYSYFSGMESALVFFLYTIFFCYCIDNKFGLPESKINYFFSGCLSGLIILSRLDQIFLISSFLLYVQISNNFPLKERLAQSIKFTGGFLCLFIPYLALNYLFTGSVMPISGRLKSGLPYVNFNLSYALDVMSVIAIVSLISSLWIISGKYIKKNFLPRALNSIYVIFCLTMLSHFLYSVLFMRWGVFKWHFSVYVFFGILFSLPLIEVLSEKLKSKYTTIVAAVILLSANVLFVKDIRWNYKYVRMRGENHWHVQSYKAAMWAKENSDVQTIFAMSDAGFFSFFSERKVINLDGVVNNADYQEVLKNHRLYSYLKSHNVKYIVHHAVWDKEDVMNGSYAAFTKSYPSHLYPGVSDSLVLKKENEVYRSMPYTDGPHDAMLVIWKLE